MSPLSPDRWLTRCASGLGRSAGDAALRAGLSPRVEAWNLLEDPLSDLGGLNDVGNCRVC
jgi:hypothetical protein